MKKIDFQQLNIMCVGDIILDTFVTGTTDRISPEAPVPVLKESSRKSMLGGAANVAVNLAELGCNVTLVGVIGNDKEANQVLSLIEKYKNIVSFVVVDRERPTTHKCRLSASGQHMIRLDNESIEPVTGDVEAQIINIIKSEAAEHDAILVSDYDKGVLTNGVVDEIHKVSEHVFRAANIKNRIDIFKGFDLITMNQYEFAKLTNGNTDIFQNLAIRSAIVTHGAKGIKGYLQHDGHQEVIELPAHNNNPVDVSGAGDTVVATAVACLCAAESFESAVKLANRAGGIVVSKSGTSSISAVELTSDISEFSAVEMAGHAHSHGLRLGLVNGCFDIIHDGHIQLLEQAKKHCDILIVAINDDEYISKNKGDHRPVFNKAQRMDILRSIRAVDSVCAFGEDNPGRIIQTLQPHVIIKGIEYKDIDLPELQSVQAVGAEIVFVETTNSKRSSDFANDIKKLSK